MTNTIQHGLFQSHRISAYEMYTSSYSSYSSVPPSGVRLSARLSIIHPFICPSIHESTMFIRWLPLKALLLLIIRVIVVIVTKTTRGNNKTIQWLFMCEGGEKVTKKLKTLNSDKLT